MNANQVNSTVKEGSTVYQDRGRATKRKYRKLMRKGHTREEALVGAEMFQSIRNVRIRTGLGTERAGGPGSASSSGSITVAVACEDYPLDSLTPQQAKQIKSALLKKVVNEKNSELKPHFESFSFDRQKGYFLIQCSDENTLEWLKQTIALQYLWDDVVLKVAAETNLINEDTHTLYSGRFRDSVQHDNKSILDFVQRQNCGLKTSKWNILGRKQRLKSGLVILTLAVDPESDWDIEKRNYKLNYNAGQVEFEKLNNGPKAQSHSGNWPQGQSALFGSIWHNNFQQESIRSTFSDQSVSSAGNFIGNLQQNRANNYGNSNSHSFPFGNATRNVPQNRDPTWTTNQDFSFGNSGGNLQLNRNNNFGNSSNFCGQNFSLGNATGNFWQNRAESITQESFRSNSATQNVYSGNSSGNFQHNRSGSNVEDQPFWKDLFGSNVPSGNTNGYWNTPGNFSGDSNSNFAFGNSFGNAGNSFGGGGNSFGAWGNSIRGGRDNSLGGGKWPNNCPRASAGWYGLQ